MTTDELKKEAERKCVDDTHYCIGGFGGNAYCEGYLAGAEPREKRIAELEKENAELDSQKNRNKYCYSCVNATEKCFRNEIGCPCEKYKSYKDENAELEREIRCECSRCVYSDSACIRSDYGVEKEEDVCPNYENVFVAYSQLKKENAELKLKLEALDGQTPWKDIKDKSEVIGQLTKAKEIITELYHSIPSSMADYYKDAMEKAENFLKGDEKSEEQDEPYYVILNMNCDYEICRRCPKSGLFKGTYEECENWIKEKLSEVEK